MTKLRQKSERLLTLAAQTTVFCAGLAFLFFYGVIRNKKEDSYRTRLY